MELLEKAKALGIQNAEKLSSDKLAKAIKNAEEKEVAYKAVLEKAKVLGVDTEGLKPKDVVEAVTAAEFLVFLQNKAKELGIKTDGISAEQLSEKISNAEALNVYIVKEARDAELLAILSEYLGIQDIDSLTKEQVVALLEKKKQEEVNGVEAEVVVFEEGKTDESVKASNGLEYVFKEDAPASFRYLGLFRSQQEWIADQDAIDLMVAGKLSFLTLKK